MVPMSASAQRLGGYFREAGLRYEVGPNDPPVPSEVRPLSYLDQWRVLNERGWYSYRLEDHSLLVLLEGGNPSFSFYPCPLDAKPRHVFAAEQGISGSGMYRSDFTEAYELHLLTANVREHVVPIRYDYDPGNYDERAHPLAHLHFGHESNIRVGCNREWNAAAFGLFILRQNFPDFWRILVDRPTVNGIERIVRSGLVELPISACDPIYRREVYLT
jgi:hypothetical protein